MVGRHFHIRDLVGTERRSRLAAAVLIVGSVLHPAYAQEFPTRMVKIVVPFPAGGSADVVPRVVADWLSRRWGQAVIIENRAGAAGNIGAELAYKAEPDGYTLLSTPPPPLVVNQSLYPKLKFDPASFERIIVLARIPNAIVAASTFAAKNVSELIAYAKANPNKINCAIAGYGTTSHLTSELFQMMAGVKFQHVPYTGSAPALNDLAGGTVDIMFDNLGVARALVDSGKLRLLAVASAKRISSLPGVPTVAETLPGLRIGRVLHGGRSTRNPIADRQKDQRGHRRSPSQSGRCGAARGTFRGHRRRNSRANERLSAR